MESQENWQNENDRKKSIYLRTSLDERINAITGGSELISITKLPRLLPISYQTIKNKIYLGTFPLQIVRFGSKNYVRTVDVVRLIENSERNGISIRKKVGRKTNRKRASLLDPALEK
jgi:hypothetical protein